MDEITTTIIGITAGVLTTGSWVPQAIKTIRSRSAEDFHAVYLVAFTLGIACWGGYGFLKKDIAVILPNVVTFMLLIPINWIRFVSRPKH